MNRFLSAFVAGLALLFSACTSNTRTTEVTTANPPAAPAVIPENPTAPNGLQPIITHYLHIKNALAADNSGEAATGAQQLLDVLPEVSKSGLTETQTQALREQEAGLQEHSKAISLGSGNVANIGMQRTHFEMLSQNVYALVKAGGAGQTLYKDFCPMYKDKGAFWLSEKKEIANPYYGSEMLTCGKVQETLQ